GAGRPAVESTYGAVARARRFRWRCAGLVFGAVAASCTRYHPAPIDPNEYPSHFATRRLDDEAVRRLMTNVRPAHATPWPPVRWDRADLLVAALAQNPRVTASHASLLAAQAEAGVARMRPDPTINLLSEYSREAAGSSPWLLGLGLDIPLDLGAQRSARISRADLVATQAAYDHADVVWSARSALHRALSGWLLTEREIAMLEATVHDHQD